LIEVIAASQKKHPCLVLLFLMCAKGMLRGNQNPTFIVYSEAMYYSIWLFKIDSICSNGIWFCSE